MSSRTAAELDAAGARYQTLVTPHLDALLAFAARRTPARPEAEDAVQEACTRAWLAFAELRDDARVRPWLYRILRSVLSDARERSGRRQRLVSITRLEDEHAALVDAAEDSVFAEVSARLTSEVVRAALDAIPDDFAAAVELHDLEGFKYQEIADVLEIPIGTVMSRISRGRRLLAGAVAANQRAWLDRPARAGRGAVQ
jgi:RNA polymerase sigma-70 factor (ECF subfamily)